MKKKTESSTTTIATEKTGKIKSKKTTRRKRITKVNINPKIYKIKRKNKVILGKEKLVCDGYCDDTRSEICLDKNLSISSDKVILLHEIIHAILHSAGLNKFQKSEELIVSMVSPGLIRFMRENRNVVRYLIEEDE